MGWALTNEVFSNQLSVSLNILQVVTDWIRCRKYTWTDRYGISARATYMFREYGSPLQRYPSNSGATDHTREAINQCSLHAPFFKGAGKRGKLMAAINLGTTLRCGLVLVKSTSPPPPSVLTSFERLDWFLRRKKQQIDTAYL